MGCLHSSVASYVRLMGLLRTVSLFWFTNFHSKIKTSYFLQILVWIPFWPRWHTNAQHTGMPLLLLLLLSHFSSVQLCATPETAAHQAPPSLGFSRQEHWSGLPFPSLMHESEKWKWSRSVMSNSLWPHGLQPTRLLCPWDFLGKSTGVGCHCLTHQMYLILKRPLTVLFHFMKCQE